MAEQAIRAYNADRRVQAQERTALAVLGSGFTRGNVERQMRALNTAYRTRASNRDLVVISGRIESRFPRWQELLPRASPSMAWSISQFSRS